jgi:hypothetical protein
MPHSQLRDHMDDLWRAMKTLWCQCNCHGHEVRFGLLKSTEDKNLVSFDMLTKFAHDQFGGRFRWGESKIRIALQGYNPYFRRSQSPQANGVQPFTKEKILSLIHGR